MQLAACCDNVFSVQFHIGTWPLGVISYCEIVVLLAIRTFSKIARSLVKLIERLHSLERCDWSLDCALVRGGLLS